MVRWFCRLLLWGGISLSLPPTKQDSTQSQWTGGRLQWGFTWEKGRARAEARTLLDYAGHRPTSCSVGLMSLAGHRPKSGSRHVCLIISWTGRQGPVLYKGDNVSTMHFAHPKVGQVCYWFRYSVRHDCQTAQLRPGKYLLLGRCSYLWWFGSTLLGLVVELLSVFGWSLRSELVFATELICVRAPALFLINSPMCAVWFELTSTWVSSVSVPDFVEFILGRVV